MRPFSPVGRPPSNVTVTSSAAISTDEIEPLIPDAQLAGHLLGVRGREVTGLELAEAAVNPDARWRADLAMQVGAPTVDERA